VPCEGSAACEIGFNGDYVLDALAAMTTEKAEVWLKDGKNAVELRPHAGVQYRSVIMPMRI
jgi:DNA polymerase III sliding clamp (beta) subunit (PCNA family)